MTLSRFLRDYVYFSLGGNRLGSGRRYVNIMTTMLVGGLWHGAGWTFVLWGGLHGLYLIMNHGWRTLRAHASATTPGVIESAVGWILTLLAVMAAWVIFRAANLDVAIEIYRAMLGMNGATLPNQVLSVLPAFFGTFITGVGNVPHLGDGTVMGLFELSIMIPLGLAIALWAPNLYQMSDRTRLALLIPSFAFVVHEVIFSRDISPFLYFQF